MKWQTLISLVMPTGAVITQLVMLSGESRSNLDLICFLLVFGCVFQLWWTVRSLNHQKLLHAFDQYALQQAARARTCPVERSTLHTQSHLNAQNERT